jgi:hypothetical protein
VPAQSEITSTSQDQSYRYKKALTLVKNGREKETSVSDQSTKARSDVRLGRRLALIEKVNYNEGGRIH